MHYSELEPGRLTARNLERNEIAVTKNLEKPKVIVKSPTNIKEKPVSSPNTKIHTTRIQTGKERKKPTWALTEKQVEEIKEKDVDNLLDFAYKLDYDKYIEDFEVRQALEVLKDRIQELKKDPNWRENFDIIHNKDLEEEKLLDTNNDKLPEIKSIVSQGKSIKSIVDTVQELKEKKKEEKPEWDKSVKSVDKINVEEKAARQIATQILENAPQLKGIHSKTSLQRILEREGRVRLTKRTEPQIVIIKDEGIIRGIDPSNLPYLHRNEAI